LWKECWRPVYRAGAEGNQKKNVVERKASVLMEIKRE
jgi:hypothetical protein